MQLLKHVDDNEEAVMTNNNGIFLCSCYKNVRKELCLRQHHRDMDKYAFIFLMVTFYIVLLRNICYEEDSNMQNLINVIKEMDK